MGLNLRLAFRFLWKNKLYSIINIAGLSLGLACCFIILLHVRFETGFDKLHEKKEKIAIVMHGDWSYTPYVMTDAMVDFFPEIEKIVRFARLDWAGFYVVKSNSFVKEYNALYADSTFFDIFTFPVIAGDPSEILRSPDKIMLSETMAKKHFGSTDVMGKTITLRLFNGNYTFTIEGVYQDFPEQSHFHANCITSMKFGRKTMGEGMFTHWGANSMQTYLLLKQPEHMKTVSQRLPAFKKKYNPENLDNANYSLQLLTKIHLYSKNPGAIMEPQGSITRVIIFASIAVLVLIIAVINFILLSLSLSYQRIREFGIRKIVGAFGTDLVSLVSTEFLIVFVLAVQISLMIVELSIPWFKSHLGFLVYKGIFSNIGLLTSFLAVVFLLGFLSSIYITINVSRIKPVESLRNKLPVVRNLIPARSILFIFQFSVMAGLLICLFIMQKQLRLTRDKDLGYRKEELLSLDVPQTNDGEEQTITFGRRQTNKYKLFLEELKKIPGVLTASGANYIPPTSQWWLSYYKMPGSDEKFDLETIQGEDGLAETLGLEMLAGRTFSPEFASDSSAILVNETAIRKMGFLKAEDALDQLIVTDSPNPVRLKIIGVFRDFHMRSLYDNIQPMAIFLNSQIIQYLAIRLQTGDNRGTISDIKKLWNSVYPDDPIEMTFVDEELHLRYSKDDQAHSLISMFSFISLVIALMGLFGLSTNAVERRTRETGIRKVNGAKPSDILMVLSKQFLMWIIIAFCVAVPASWYAMHKWLQHFAYRTEISGWVFLSSLLISLSIAFITILWQTYRAAKMNPADALRYE
ncbi:MAG TPA: ABC transporter permease [Bacteroidales bacterium]|jgi:putative ABC transport system permease protein|nr:ABC transporter permease [Bacteroidales bacterium]